MLKKHGFVRVGACVPELKIANVKFNASEIIGEIQKAYERGVQILVFPELSITAYTCSDLFHQDVLLKSALEGLKEIVDSTAMLDIISIVGVPLRLDNQLFNTAAVINKGKILGIVPKTYIPNYSEFYEKRWFAASTNAISNEIELFGNVIPFGTNILFEDETDKGICFGIELCEDLWSLFPPSSVHALKGATMIFNLSASNEIIGKAEYRRGLVKFQSSKTISAYIYTSAGVNESTTDVVFSGHSLIAENGNVLNENDRFDFKSNLIISDVDIQKIVNNRYKDISFMGLINDTEYRKVKINIQDNLTETIRRYDRYPFVPSNLAKRNERCLEIFRIQSCALAKRLKHIGIQKTVIGISGGLDSTLALLVIVEAYKKLGISNDNIIAITMPGFGTSGRTYANSINLMKQYGVSMREISIREACLQHFKDINHDENIHDITYENTQARERTKILMDVANQENGIVIGTGDLSELALGWCTYNGDHMSMYAVNSSIPKTLVRYLVTWIADNETDEENKKTVYDILDTPISPELLPPGEKGDIKQETEATVGPYVLHDFFLYHFFRYGALPSKIYFIAKEAFNGDYSDEEIKKWLKFFLKRFFTQQFKRSCMPDGPKVGTISLSPRGDLRMASDASYDVWLDGLE